ncbi:MAG TPA: SDR family NAD(P)-dependent oxidoreductase [Mycobacteriales bacterium]|nr:SDR family NAD(P)-dependent oxidoreductase [Mycobacteriales bacterium]HWA65755.1 SDR family NAD(P)-dependent oxidoreductase [Mycobacteriales bacterium]
MSIDPELTGKRALVTGAGQGVGEAIARQLAEAGCDVVVNDFHEDRADRVATAIRCAGGSAQPLPFDVTDHDAVTTAIHGQGRIDILVNNAGNGGPDTFGTIAAFVDTAPADWSPLLAVNLGGVMNCTHAVLPAMIEAGWGRVVTISSDAGRTGGARYAAYSAAKAGAAGFSRAIAREVARHGVTVNVVSLGTMRTPLTEPLWRDPANTELQQSILAGYLVRRPGEPDDVAWAVLSLASPRSSWVTGQTIAVNGGSALTL